MTNCRRMHVKVMQVKDWHKIPYILTFRITVNFINFFAQNYLHRKLIQFISFYHLPCVRDLHLYRNQSFGKGVLVLRLYMDARTNVCAYVWLYKYRSDTLKIIVAHHLILCTHLYIYLITYYPPKWPKSQRVLTNDWIVGSNLKCPKSRVANVLRLSSKNLFLWLKYLIIDTFIHT